VALSSLAVDASGSVRDAPVTHRFFRRGQLLKASRSATFLFQRIKGSFEHLVRIAEVTGLNLCIHALHQPRLTDFEVHSGSSLSGYARSTENGIRENPRETEVCGREAVLTLCPERGWSTMEKRMATDVQLCLMMGAPTLANAFKREKASIGRCR